MTATLTQVVKQFQQDWTGQLEPEAILMACRGVAYRWRERTLWTCSHDTGHIWEEILTHPSESMSRTLKDLERQAFTVFWGMIHLSL